jgi:predicted transcriptional regulator
MPAPPARRPQPLPPGLGELRRRGSITELLFLYECTTSEPTQLRPIAEKLGLTVQAISHSYRQLARRGLAEVRDGRYRATVSGVAWLHAALGVLREDVQGRLERLDVVRSCRALALGNLPAGTSVSLELVDGLLSARPGGGGASRGIVRTSAQRGELVEVDRLEGIVPIARGRVRVVPLPIARLRDRALPARLRALVRRSGPALLGAQGLEAYHLLAKAVDRPIVRFAVAGACREASQVGVDSTVVVLDEDLPRLLHQFTGNDAPPLEITPLG